MTGIREISVAVYPKEYIDNLTTDIAKLKEDIRSGNRPVFYNLDAMFAELDKRSISI